MHGITRCPNCHKAFRVAHTQLASAKGRVKCGSCKHVFNATDYWLISQFDKNEDQLRKLNFELKQAKTNNSNSWVAAIILVGVCVLFGQYAWEYPGRIVAKIPPAEKAYSLVASILNTNKPTIDLRDLSLAHHTGRVFNEGKHLRIDGIVKNQSPTKQKTPNLRIDLTLANGEKASRLINSAEINWSNTTLAKGSQSQFAVWLEMQLSQVVDYKVSLCCQPKN